MRNPSDNWEELRQKVLGLGDSSVHKTHYPALKQRLEELEQMTQELKRSEAYLAEAQALSQTGSFGWKVQTEEHIWSEQTYRIFEFDRASQLTLERIIERIHPEDRSRVAQALKQSSENSQDFDYEHRLLMPDGRVKHLHVLAKAMPDSSGSIEFVGAVMDITAAKRADRDRQKAEEALRQSEAYLTEAQRLSHTGNWAWDPSYDKMLYCSEEIYRIYGMDAQEGVPTIERFMERVHPDDRALVRDRSLEGADRKTKHIIEYRLMLPDGTTKYIQSVRHPVLNDAGEIVEIIGTAIDLTERKRAEDALRESETRFRTFVDHAADAFFVHEPEHKILDVNRQACENLGYSREELIGMHPLDFDPDIDAAQLQQISERLAAGEVFTFETRHRRKDGTVFPVEVRLRSFWRGDRRLHLSLVRDITERKLAEEKLRQSEAELRQMIEAIPQQVFVFDPDWNPVFANRRELEYIGLSLEEAQSRNAIARVLHPEDMKRLQDARARARSNGAPVEIEVRIRGRDGRYRWFLIRDNPLRDEQGRILRWYGTRTDIEDRKRAEELVRQSEAELQQILDAAPQNLAVLGPDRSRTYLNKAVLEYLGMTHEEGITCDLSKLFHPDDLEQLNRKVQSGFLTGAQIESEARMPRHDGVYRWFLLRYKPLHDDRGRITRWVVTATDIEERKQAEERLQHENVALREEVDKASMFEEIVGSSSALRVVLSRVAKVAPTDSTVLITGETGTGKELIARAIHKRSRRSARTFVSVNCAAIPRDLIASELFGHEKGAFTGATQRRLGRFELAEGGTIFLDEIAELPAETQVALLRVLQEREFERVGGGQPIRADVRVIAATNRDVKAAIEAGDFRSDLFFRLNVFPIETPPLRKRKEDIPLLVEYFIDRYARKTGKSIKRVNKRSLELLQSYPWPGNIRELQNIIERSVIVCESENFSVDESWLSSQARASVQKDPIGLSQMLAAQEQETIEAALRECNGRVSGPSGAAARLGMPRSTLESKIRSFNIEKSRFKNH